MMMFISASKLAIERRRITSEPIPSSLRTALTAAAASPPLVKSLPTIR